MICLALHRLSPKREVGLLERRRRHVQSEVCQLLFDRRLIQYRCRIHLNEANWGGAPKIDRLAIRQIPQASTRVASLLGGESQVIEEVPVDQIEQVSSDSDNRILDTTSSADMVLSFDTRTAPIRQPQVREALDMAIDKPTILKQILNGRVELLLQSQFLTAASFGFDLKLRARLRAREGKRTAEVGQLRLLHPAADLLPAGRVPLRRVHRERRRRHIEQDRRP